MGNGYRTTVTDLLLEDWYHASVRAKNISEPGSNELGFSLDITRLDGLIETLSIYFTDSYAAAHRICQIHCLVC